MSKTGRTIVPLSAALLAGLAALPGCADKREASRWAPTLLIAGRIRHGITRRAREHEEQRDRWDGRIHLGARWRSRPPGPAMPTAPVRRPRAGIPPPPQCANALLCAWERRARTRALRRLVVEIDARRSRTRHAQEPIR